MGNLRPEGFEGEDLRGRTMPEEMGISCFRDADMRETDWRGTTCSHVSILDADLRGAQWEGCTFNLVSHAVDMDIWEAHHN
ncbi:MAG: pentapeptide repeat-containing protein, partial [Candidatus Andersenbacteria bacterium]|nr:pentapeptide repeat-containing protein [Candidatus Andersenbacteria bacterium]